MRNRVATLLQTVVFMLALSSVPAAHALEIYGGAEGTATTFYWSVQQCDQQPQLFRHLRRHRHRV